MNQQIAFLSLIVPDYDEAIGYFTRTLGFQLEENTDLGGGKRWVVVKPVGEAATGLVLAKAKTDEEKQLVGHQGAGRVWLFLHTDDFERDYERLRQNGVSFLEEPRKEAYGTVAVFEDRYGNKWDLLEPKS